MKNRGLLFSVLSGLFGVAFYFSGLFVLFTPLSFLYSAARSGAKGFWISCLTALVAVGSIYFWFLPFSLAHPEASWQAWIAWPGFGFLPTAEISVLRFFGIGYFCYYSLVALFLSIGMWKNWRLITWGTWGIFCPALFLIFFSLVAEFFFSLPVISTIRSYLQQLVETMVGLEKDFSTSFQADLLLSYKDQMVDFVVYSLPGLLFAMTTLTFLVNLWGARMALRARSLVRSQIDFLKLQIPFGVIWVVIASGSIFFINQYFFEFVWLKFVAINSLLAVIGFYFFQGLSIAIYFIRKRSLWFRMGLYGVMIVFLQTMAAILIGLGFADVWFDFRKLNKNKGA